MRDRIITLKRLVIVVGTAVFGLWNWTIRGGNTPPLTNVVTLAPSPATSPSRQTFVDLLFSDPPEASAHNPWIAENHRNLKALYHCLEVSNCRPNQDKVVILGDKNFREYLLGWNTGEIIWAGSTTEALRNLGYTLLYGLNLDRTLQLYHFLRPLVLLVILDAPSTHACFLNNELCIKSVENPGGIPIWKLFSFHFWQNADHPLGADWTLSPEQWQLARSGSFENNTYVGYSIETSCHSQTFVPHADRENQAYIMTKRLQYFVPGKGRAWPSDYFSEALAGTGIQFAAGLVRDHHPVQGTPDLPANLLDHGELKRKEFMGVLAKTKVLIGMGNPATSPTPYEALCLGVPFINPISRWDPVNPSDRTAWDAQHAILKLLGPPYVYNVFEGDRAGFVNAIKAALANPITSYVPPHMKSNSVEERLAHILTTDWKAKAERVLAQRRDTWQGALFVI